MNKKKKILIAVLIIVLLVILVFEGLYITGSFSKKESKTTSSSNKKGYNDIALDGYSFSLSNDYSYRKIDDNYIAYYNEKLGYYAYLYPVAEAYSEDNYNTLKTSLKNINNFITTEEFSYELGDKVYNVIDGSLKGTNTYVIYGTLSENSIIAYIVLDDGDMVDDIYDDFYDITARAAMVESPTTSIQNIKVPNNLYNPMY